MMLTLWRMVMVWLARKVLERWDEPSTISVSVYPESFKRWWDEQVAEHGKPEVSFRVDEPEMEQPKLPPIPSSAQLVREYTQSEVDVCICGHLRRGHGPDGCYELHDAKPCVCPRFFA